MAINYTNPVVNFGGNPVAVGDNTGLGGLATSFYDLFRGINGTDTARAATAAKVADPFMDQRQQYQDQLAALMKDPSSFNKDPGYQFALGEGQKSIESASNALYGTGRTGTLAPELARFTEGYAADAYNTRINQLATLGGATTGSPAVAGQLTAGGYANEDKSLASGIGGIASLLASAFGLTGTGAEQFISMFNKIVGGGGAGAGAGYSIDPATGRVTYGSGPGSSTGAGNQGGYPGDDGNGYTPGGAPTLDFGGDQNGSDWANGLSTSGQGIDEFAGGLDLSGLFGGDSPFGDFLGAGMGP